MENPFGFFVFGDLAETVQRIPEEDKRWVRFPQSPQKMVDVAQLVERLIVVQEVAGS